MDFGTDHFEKRLSLKTVMKRKEEIGRICRACEKLEMRAFVQGMEETLNKGWGARGQRKLAIGG